MNGVIPAIRRFLFGEPPPARCECAVSHCHSAADPRCEGGNCTTCCVSQLRCGGKCLRPKTPDEAELEALTKMWNGGKE